MFSPKNYVSPSEGEYKKQEKKSINVHYINKKRKKKSIIINNININEQTNSFIFFFKKKKNKILFIYKYKITQQETKDYNYISLFIN